VGRITSKVLSLRTDGELLDRLTERAARRQMSLQDYMVRTLTRDDFDERFRTAVEETERFYRGTGYSGAHTETGEGGLDDALEQVDQR
jgi:hypothetical protein